jgi:hypothetical protein
MDAPLAIAALVVVALGFELRRLVELARLARDRNRETPAVIRSMPLTFRNPPAPYQSSTTGETP